MKLAKKTKQPEPVDEVSEVEEVRSAEESQKESDLIDLQRTVAELELRIENIDRVVDDEVEKRVAQFMSTMGGYLSRVEMSTFARIAEFFQQCPLWELHKLTKKNAGASAFYSPYAEMKSLMSRGWKWMGQFYDEQAKENYHLFIRQKELPQYKDKILALYEQFKEPPAPEKVSVKRLPTKVGVKTKVTITAKTKK